MENKGETTVYRKLWKPAAVGAVVLGAFFAGKACDRSGSGNYTQRPVTQVGDEILYASRRGDRPQLREILSTSHSDSVYAALHRLFSMPGFESFRERYPDYRSVVSIGYRDALLKAVLEASFARAAESYDAWKQAEHMKKTEWKIMREDAERFGGYYKGDRPLTPEERRQYQELLNVVPESGKPLTPEQQKQRELEQLRKNIENSAQEAAKKAEEFLKGLQSQKKKTP